METVNESKENSTEPKENKTGVNEKYSKDILGNPKNYCWIDNTLIPIADGKKNEFKYMVQFLHKQWVKTTVCEETAIIKYNMYISSIRRLYGLMLKSQDKYRYHGLTIKEIREIIMAERLNNEFQEFASWDFNNKSDQTRFGNIIRSLINKPVNIHIGEQGETVAKLTITMPHTRTNRIRYRIVVSNQCS